MGMVHLNFSFVPKSTGRKKNFLLLKKEAQQKQWFPTLNGSNSVKQ